MEDKLNLVEPLLERAQAYSKTSYELYKLKALQLASGFLSSVFSKLVVLLFVLMCIALLSIGASIWLGEILGKWYYGFFCIAGFYAFAALVMSFLLKGSIKSSVQNSIISQMLN